MPANGWLVAGGWLSLAASALHLVCIAGGPRWYRFLGAGERMAKAEERGEWRPAIVTVGIAAVLALWAAYAFAGAGVIGRLPLMRPALVAISAIYLARGLVLVMPTALGRSDLSAGFLMWSSLIVLVFGLVYAVGTYRAWPFLSNPHTG